MFRRSSPRAVVLASIPSCIHTYLSIQKYVYIHIYTTYRIKSCIEGVHSECGSVGLNSLRAFADFEEFVAFGLGLFHCLEQLA